MNWRTFKLKLSFKAKVVIPVIGVIVLLVAAMLWLVSRRIANQLQAEVARTLTTCDSVFQNSLKIRGKNLVERFANIPNDPRFRAVSQLGEAKTMQFLLNEILVETGSDMIVFTTEKGDSLASASHGRLINMAEFESGAVSSIKQAMGGQPVTDRLCVSEQFFDVVSIPVKVSDVMVGVLTVAVRIDDAVAQEFRQLTRSDIVLIVHDRVVASTLQRQGFEQQFASMLLGSTDTTGKKGTVALGHIQQIVLPEEHYLCLVGHLNSLSDDRKLGYVLLTSYEEPLQTLRETQQMLLLIGMIGALLSTLIVFALIRKLTQPLQQLRDRAEAVGRGDFSQRIQLASNDECGELAQAFNTMTENIKASRDELENTVETLKSTKAQLTQSEKLSAVGEFVAGVAHELNNPLASVIGFAQLLQKAGVDDRHRGHLARIVGESQRCHKIVQSLLSFSRQHAPERKLVRINEVIEASLDILSYQLRTSNIEVITHFDPVSPSVKVDSHQIQQVFINIMNNARQAIEADKGHGWLRITTAAFDGHARVLFQDSGPGISEENLAKIFNPFFTTKGVGKGTGLGLSLCYGIVKEHGGTITARSKPGEGATFVVELPASKETAEPTVKAEPHAPSSVAQGIFEGNGKRVLVVDDEDALRDLIHEVLTEDHYQVDAVGDAESALQKIGRTKYDLILSDFKMPGLSGPEFYHRLVMVDPDAAARMIFMTGDVAGEQTQKFLTDHGKTCISKPFLVDDFRSVVNNTLGSQ